MSILSCHLPTLDLNITIRNRAASAMPSSRPGAVLRQHTTVASDRKPCHQHPRQGVVVIRSSESPTAPPLRLRQDHHHSILGRLGKNIEWYMGVTETNCQEYQMFINHHKPWDSRGTHSLFRGSLVFHNNKAANDKPHPTVMQLMICRI